MCNIGSGYDHLTPGESVAKLCALIDDAPVLVEEMAKTIIERALNAQTTEIIDDVDATEIADRLNLATIERVIALEPIEGKDRIELLLAQGYRGVVEKGLHAVGGLVLVVKHETVLPEIPMFEWMRSFKFRVKSKSFSTENGKIYSQCICIPIKEVINYFVEKGEKEKVLHLREGVDLTEELGVKKYMPVLSNATGTQFGTMRSKGTFPSQYISKTDETNLQGAVKLLEELQGKPYSITFKMEGSSLTALERPDTKEYIVCSRSNILDYDESNSFWYASKKYELDAALKDRNWAVQGELCGMKPDGSHKIQSNVMGLKDIELYVFNVIDLETGKRIDFQHQLEWCLENSIPHVPVYEVGESFDYTLDQLLTLVQTLKYPLGKEQICEGIVIRPQEDTYSNKLHGSLSVKVKNPAYNFNELAKQK